MKSYNIKKGNHYSSFSLPKLFFKANKLSKQVVFQDNCRYDLKTEDQLDTNKLFGIGYLPWHHQNSVRFGWRYDVQKGQIEILAYWYKNKSRHIETMCFIDLNQSYTYSIEITKIEHKLTITSGTNIVAQMNIEIGEKFFGYFLKPFFGGNRTAPHDMTINFL